MEAEEVAVVRDWGTTIPYRSISQERTIKDTITRGSFMRIKMDTHCFFES